MLYYHKATEMLLLTEKLKRKCYVLYETERILTLREKCPNTDQKKLRIWTLFTHCNYYKNVLPLLKFLFFDFKFLNMIFLFTVSKAEFRDFGKEVLWSATMVG